MGRAEERAENNIGDGFAEEGVGPECTFARTGLGECKPALEAAKDAALISIEFELVWLGLGGVRGLT